MGNQSGWAVAIGILGLAVAGPAMAEVDLPGTGSDPSGYYLGSETYGVLLQDGELGLNGRFERQREGFGIHWMGDLALIERSDFTGNFSTARVGVGLGHAEGGSHRLSVYGGGRFDHITLTGDQRDWETGWFTEVRADYGLGDSMGVTASGAYTYFDENFEGFQFRGAVHVNLPIFEFTRLEAAYLADVGELEFGDRIELNLRVFPAAME